MTQLSRQLVDREVLVDDGTFLGKLERYIADFGTGEVETLVVEPGEKTPPKVTFDRVKNGYIHVPTENVKTVGEQIVVER